MPQKVSKSSPTRLRPVHHEKRPMMTTYTIDPWKFAQDWQDGWNSHDLDRIMAHYHKDVVFRSVKAQALVGKGNSLVVTNYAAIGPKPLSANLISNFKYKKCFKAIR